MKDLNTRIRGKDKNTSIKLVGKRGTKLTEPGADCIERVDTCKTTCPVLILHSIEITWTSLADL